MAGLHGFDGEKEYGGFCIPNGSYRAAITESDEHQNSRKTGSYLKLVFTILEGEHKDRSIWVNLNLDNPSEQAVRISRAVLKQICVACGGIKPTDSADLHDIPMCITVDKEQRSDNGEWKNKITRFASLMDPPSEADLAATQAPWKA
jgi:hypothetical protein